MASVLLTTATVTVKKSFAGQVIESKSINVKFAKFRQSSDQNFEELM
jgi:hypothetical protein